MSIPLVSQLSVIILKSHHKVTFLTAVIWSVLFLSPYSTHYVTMAFLTNDEHVFCLSMYLFWSSVDKYYKLQQSEGNRAFSQWERRLNLQVIFSTEADQRILRVCLIRWRH